MKEWANKPAALLTSGSSTVQTSGSLVQTSGSLVKTSSLAPTLTSGTSTSLTTTSSAVSSLGKGSGVAAAIAQAVPVVAGATVAAIAAGVYGVSNMVKYSKGEKSGGMAVKDTVKGSAGMGVSAGVGVAVGHAVAGTVLALGTTVVVPVVAGFAAAYGSLRVWHKLFFGGAAVSKAT